MDSSKFFSFLFLFLLFGCKNITYTEDDSYFWAIYLLEWNSKICPKKVVYERYVKNSNFNELIKTDSEFKIEDCEDIYKSSNQRILIPTILYTGKIEYDIRLILDDSIEYKITCVDNKIDTVFYGGRPGDFTVMNNISSFTVNGCKVDNKKSPLNISIPTKLRKNIKK